MFIAAAIGAVAFLPSIALNIALACGAPWGAYAMNAQHLANIADIKGVQQKIEWGSQIRNYVFMPYTLVKDTRTGCETANVNGVMDGALDPFIESYLNCLATGNWVQK